jgi:hypothetical protein
MPVASSPSMLPALMKMKCPRCRQGNVFRNQNPYNLKQVGDMYDLCPVCNLNFRPEPGFYFGGAMISYPMMIFINVIVFLIYYFITGNVFDRPLLLMSILALATLLAAPVVFRYSRIIFLYILVGFRKS